MFVFSLLTLTATAEIASDYSLNSPLASPETGLLSNTAIDIIGYNGGVWMITGKGIMFSSDRGQTWLRYDVSNGLVSSNVSSIFAHPGGRLWIGSAHEQELSGQLYTLSDGVSFTTDFGNLWTQIDFSSTGQDIPHVWGIDQTVFDITGMNDPVDGRQWVFFGAFAGGLLASQDNGDYWRRIYASLSDSVQYNDATQVPSLRNRIFSCVADSSHADSVFLWVGTAGGLIQHVWLRPEDKLYSQQFNSVVLCDTCTDSSETALFVGGDRALSIGRRTGGPFRSELTGLFANAFVNKVDELDNRLFVGQIDVGQQPRLLYSDDLGVSFTPVTVSGLTDSIGGFAAMAGRYYMAAQSAGLFVSADSGITWDSLLIDSADPGSALNSVNAVSVLADTLLVGTDSGLVSLFMAANGDIDSLAILGFLEDDARSRRVIFVTTQYYNYDTLAGTYDSLIYWTINRPATAAGTAMVGRSPDRTAQFAFLKPDSLIYDIDFVGDTVYMVGEHGVFYSNDVKPPFFFTRLTVASSGTSLTGEIVYDMEIDSNRIILATDRSVAVSHETDSTRTWAIYRGNLDTLTSDIVVNYTYENTLFADTAAIRVGLTGDFIPALAVQYRDTDRPRIWASGRPVSAGGNGLAVARFNADTNGDITLHWRGINFTDFAWNFAFNGDTVFAATNAGLLWKDMKDSIDISDGSFSTSWDTLVFNQSPDLILEPGTPVYAAAVVDDDLWLGTADGTVVVALSDFTDQTLFKAENLETPNDEVFAFPTPFRPNQGGTIDFHFTVERDAAVTIEIYDFAMNLVARPVDNVTYPAGTYHGTSAGGGQGPTWDGYNGKGDLVAVGMYYFKVAYSTGDTRWGKIAVIP